jgi:5-methylcytosine-specific restriction endonuclease McrA
MKKADPFYLSKGWRALRDDVLADDKHECQYCKAKGKYKRAAIVHHVQHRDEHPELELERYYIDSNGVKQRNLVSLCFDCHEEQHPERSRKIKNKKPLTPERW